MTRKRFYASSNGDTWDLVGEGEHILVLHTPNRASGGQPTRSELATFLAREPHTAQVVALVRLIGTLLDQEGEAVAPTGERAGDAIAQGAGMTTGA